MYKFINYTPYCIEFAPYNSSYHDILLPVKISEIGLEIHREVCKYNDIPVCEMYYTVELPEILNTVYIVPVDVKLDFKFKNRKDVVTIGDAYRGKKDTMIVHTLLE